MGIFRAACMAFGLEPCSDGISTADASRGAATAAASIPPVVVVKFLRLRELGEKVGSMNVPREIQSVGDQGPALRESPSNFHLPQHYTQVAGDTAEKLSSLLQKRRD